VSTAVCLNGWAPLPLVLRWGGTAQPLPLRPIRPTRHLSRSFPSVLPQPWLQTGPVEQAFDFCGHVQRLCADIVRRCAELEHVDIGRLLFGVTQARSPRSEGLQARVTPLRFRGGALHRRRRSVTYQVQRYVVGDTDMLYLVTFCLPRFLDQDFDDKFITLFHELFHIGPAFDGDLRRHAGRCTIHSHSKRHYDSQMAHLARAYLASRPDAGLHDFLRLGFAQLCARHGSVVGVMVPRPKLIPLNGLVE
jgi:hypothetical protein